MSVTPNFRSVTERHCLLKGILSQYYLIFLFAIHCNYGMWTTETIRTLDAVNFSESVTHIKAKLSQ